MNYRGSFTGYIVSNMFCAFLAGLIAKQMVGRTLPALDNITFVAFTVLAFMLLVMLRGGKLSPFAFWKQCQRIGLHNKNGECPLLISVKSDDMSSHGFIMTILNRGISLPELENLRDRLEAGLDIIIDQIKYVEASRQLTQIYAVPAKYDLPSFIPWKEKYLSQVTHEVNLGQGLTNNITWDYTKQIHIIVAGTTGSGKSALVRVILHHLLHYANAHKVYILDFKQVDYAGSYYRSNAQVISDEVKFLETLKDLVGEMRARLTELQRANQRNIDDFNACIRPTWKHLFVVIDEASELFAASYDANSKARSKEILGLLISICRLGRAAGLHVLLSTQRPSVDSIPGSIRSCVDAKVCGKVTSDTESIIVLDNASAARRIPYPIPGRFLFNDRLFQAYYIDDEGGDQHDKP